MLRRDFLMLTAAIVAGVVAGAPMSPIGCPQGGEVVSRGGSSLLAQASDISVNQWKTPASGLRV